MRELTAFCWTCFGSEGLHRKPVSFLSSSARWHCHSVHSPFLNVFLQRGFEADSESEHHGDSIWEQSHRAVQLQMSECFIARGICFSALAGDGEQECGVDRGAHTAVGVPGAQARVPNSQSPLSGAEPSTSSATGSKMPCSVLFSCEPGSVKLF